MSAGPVPLILTRESSNGDFTSEPTPNNVAGTRTDTTVLPLAASRKASCRISRSPVRPRAPIRSLTPEPREDPVPVRRLESRDRAARNTAVIGPRSRAQQSPRSAGVRMSALPDQGSGKLANVVRVLNLPTAVLCAVLIPKLQRSAPDRTAAQIGIPRAVARSRRTDRPRSADSASSRTVNNESAKRTRNGSQPRM